MEKHLEQIKTDLVELKRSGAEKQLVIVEGDYKRYIKDPSPEHYVTLEQNLATLKEFAALPTFTQERAQHIAKKSRPP